MCIRDRSNDIGLDYCMLCCRMETFTNKGVSCFIYNANKYRQYYVKKNKNVCWRCTRKACKARIETRDGTVVPVTTNGAESYHGHLNCEFNAPHPNIYVFVVVLLRQQAATYVAVNSLTMSRTIKRSTREKSACLRKLFTEYSL